MHLEDEREPDDSPAAQLVPLAAFLDTNIILEGRPLAELPWEDVQCDGIILALIVPKAMEEIDAKKRDGRVGPIARAFNKLIAPSVLTGAPVVIRESGPRVVLAMAVCNRIPWNDYDELDPDDGDSRIVAEALNARDVDPTRRLLISHDIKPLAYATGRGLQVYQASDDWLRPAEPGPKDKEIQRLKQQMSELRKDEPSFKIEIGLSDINPLTVHRIAPLSADQASELTRKIKSSNRRKGQGSSFGNMYVPLFNEDYSYDRRFDKFVATTVPRFVENFNEKIETLCNQRHLKITVTNIGQIRADHLVIEVTTNSGWLNKRIVVVSPKGPIAPKMRGRFDLMPNLHNMMQAHVGRHEFDFTTEARRSRNMVATCEDFRNRQEFYFEGVYAPSSAEGEVEITVTLTAANMRGAKSETFRREKTIQDGDIASFVDTASGKMLVGYPVAEAIAQLIEAEEYDKIEWDRDPDDEED